MSRSPQTRWVAALVALVVFLLAAWLFGSVLSLTEGERTALRVGLVVLGLCLAGALLWWLRPTRAGLPTAPKAAARDEALAALTAARARLGRGGLERRPVILVVGPEQSGRTTVVTRAGLDPALLAGDAPALGPTDAPPATAAANVWLTGEGRALAGAAAGDGRAVLVEPAGAVFADAGRWQAFLRALRAPRLAAALGRGEPAPRAVVLCLSCDLFQGPSEVRDRVAQLARERLAEAARTLGVALPVYVLFTRADRIPHFEPWAAPLLPEEARAPLGAALPAEAVTGAAAVGGYAERIVPRLEQAFAALAAAVASRRLDHLGRESVAERRLAAYEFPRELAKVAPAATRLLADLCRPLQLAPYPQLRGFWFVGARPVLVTDTSAPAAAAMPVAAAAGTAGATSAFARPAAAGVPAAPSVGGYGPPTTRKVPQWTFLDRFFPEVVLADRGAAVAARGGVRVARLRRALLGAGIAAGLVVAALVARSWSNNQALADRVAAAVAGAAALPAPAVADGAPPAGSAAATPVAAAGTAGAAAPGAPAAPVLAPAAIAFPSVAALQALDSLRAVIDEIRALDRDGVGLRYGLGLWQGDALLERARPVWLAAYRRQLHDDAWRALRDTLAALPDAPRPTDEYAPHYDALRAYLITTAEPGRSTPEFLAPVLLRAWQRGGPAPEAEVATLARRQFELYARELAAAAPTGLWPATADARVVARTRGFLDRFAGAERIYASMLAEASAKVPPARLTDLAPQAPGVLAAPGDVPGAFTEKGWAFMQDAFAHADRFFQGERWVVGDAGAALAGEKDRVLADLRARYRADYVARWRAWVQGLRVVRPGDARDAGAKLGVLGGPASPILGAIALAARNTAVDSGVAAAFQPLHALTPPAVRDKLVGEKNQPYLNGLVALQGAIEQIAALPPPTDSTGAAQVSQAAVQAVAQAALAKTAARQASQLFALDADAAPVRAPVEALLLAPIEGAETVLGRVAATRAPAAKVAAGGGGGGGGGGAPPPKADAATLARINDRGKALCAAVAPLLAKFPFNPDATADATVAEVNGVFAPGTGALWAYQEEQLAGIVEKQGAEWVVKPGSPIQLTAPFLAFFNRAARVSDALYAGGAEPRVVFTVKGAGKPATFVQGTQAVKLGGNAPPAQFAWPSTSGRDARLELGYRDLVVLGRTKVVARASGEWALFRIVAQAAKWEGGNGAWRAEWNAGSQGPVAVDFTFASGAPVLGRGWMGGMACPGQVTK